jgi:hypothetical protein
MKIGIAIIMSALILLISGIAGVQSAETFRGIPWGTDKKELPDLVEGPKKGEVEAFTRREQRKVGDISVENIYYLFYKGKLGAAMITFQGASNFSGLRDALSQKYGPPQTTDPVQKEYTWDLEDLTIFFEYSDVKNKGSINYYFKPIVQQRDDDRAKARKKALEDL